MRILKSWLTLREAALLCQAALGEAMDEADLAQLALERKIQLSVIFFNGATAVFWKPVKADISFVEVPSIDEGEPAVLIGDGGPFISDHLENWFAQTDTVLTLDEDAPFDLAMIGGERAAVQEILWNGRGRRREPTINLDGVFLKPGRTTEYGLLGLAGQLPNRDREKPINYPLGCLPPDTILVVRKDAFEHFIGSIGLDALPSSAGSDLARIASDGLESYRSPNLPTHSHLSGREATFLNPEHPRYAYKLAAAVRAWEAVDSSGGKASIRLLTTWLTSNAAELGLLKQDGTLNQLGIDECAKVANWRPNGGVPRTPIDFGSHDE